MPKGNPKIKRNVKIIKLFHQNYSYAEIAEKLNTSRCTVAGLIFRYKNNDCKWLDASPS